MLLLSRKPGEVVTLQIGDIAVTKLLLDALLEAQEHLEWIGYGDAWEAECARDAKLPEKIAAAISAAGKAEEKSADIAVRVLVLDIREGRVNLGIEAPASVRILREELVAGNQEEATWLTPAGWQ